MKISRQDRTIARKLFTFCKEGEGRIHDENVRAVLRYIQERRPRNAVRILERFRKLVTLEKAKSRVGVTAAAPLEPSEREALQSRLEKVFGGAGDIQFSEEPEALGGLRIQKGSTVWDGTIQTRLDRLEQELNHR